MVSVNNNVSTTEYDYNSQTQTAQSSKEVSAPNSVYEAKEVQTNNAETTPAATPLFDKMLEEIAQKYSKYGITVEDLKKLHIAQRVHNIDQTLIANLDNKERENQVKIMKQAIEEAIKDSIKDGKVDFEKANKLTSDYDIALQTGWKLKNFKKEKSNSDNSTLFDILVKYNALPADATRENTSPEEVKAAIQKAVEHMLGKLEAADNVDKKKIEEQMKKFGLLLANSPDEDRIYFGEIIKNLHESNKYNASLVLLHSFTSKAAKRACADNMYGDMVAVCAGMNKEETAHLTRITTRECSETGLEKGHENFNQQRKDWLENNFEAYNTAITKLNNNEELSEEDKQVIKEYCTLMGISTGEFIGTAENKNISDDFKTEHLNTLNEDAYETPVYKEVLENLNTYVQENKDNLSIPSKELEKLLNNATNNNYNRVATGSNEELKAPQSTNSTEKPSANADFGFRQKETVDPARLQVLRQQITPTEEKPKFRVDKTQTATEVATPSKPSNFKDIIASTPDSEKSKVIETLYKSNAAFKLAIKAYIKMSSNPIFDLNKLPIAIRASLAKELYNADKISEEDLKKLNLSFDLEKTILND